MAMDKKIPCYVLFAYLQKFLADQIGTIYTLPSLRPTIPLLQPISGYFILQYLLIPTNVGVI
jgi:hypothetical protein